MYFFSDSRVKSNFLGEGGGISLRSRVQGPGSRVQGPVKLLGNALKMKARLIEQLRFTDLFAQYFD